VGWVLTTIANLQKELKLSNDQVAPVGIFPLGTGNDLARSFGWVCGFYALHFL
jgi:diacylglycerol kinase (ATP)